MTAVAIRNQSEKHTRSSQVSTIFKECNESPGGEEGRHQLERLTQRKRESIKLKCGGERIKSEQRKEKEERPHLRPKVKKLFLQLVSFRNIYVYN